jgi:hypothetical protein
MNFPAVDKILSAAKDWHLPVAMIIFFTGSVMQVFHHLDPTYVAFTATILGAITGHAFSPAQRDHDQQ